MSIRKYTWTGTCTICTQWQMDIKFSFFQYDTNFDLIWFFCRKAIKFYMYDICVNPLRLDSWAGLALARMYQLEQKLNSVSASMWKEFLLYFYVSSLCFFKTKYFYVAVRIKIITRNSSLSDWLKVGCVTPEALSCCPSVFWEICGYRGCVRQAVDGVWITVLPTPHPLLQAAQLPWGR